MKLDRRIAGAGPGDPWPAHSRCPAVRRASVAFVGGPPPPPKPAVSLVRRPPIVPLSAFGDGQSDACGWPLWRGASPGGGSIGTSAKAVAGSGAGS